MAGIYIHIPFCKQACHYCNFHFSTSLRNKNELLEAIVSEIGLQKDYLNNEPLETIYFGGGTPSLLEEKELDVIINALNNHHSVKEDAEITLEANPDDLSKQKLAALKRSPINRLSIGVQSFHQTDLEYMNRAHNAQEADDCIKDALDLGFQDLSIDLIYGTPTMNDDQWLANLHQTFAYKAPHVSCYALTVEPKTALDHFIKTGKSVPVDDHQSARQFELLVKEMTNANYDHYEISNFCLEGRYSKHNTAYWKGNWYLGLGPAAHSFNGDSRQWNVANNAKYIQSIKEGKVPTEVEYLSEADRYNEYIMTAFRTKWGVDLSKIINWGYRVHDRFLEEVQVFLDQGLIIRKENFFYLTQEGKFLSDGIIGDLFMD